MEKTLLAVKHKEKSYIKRKKRSVVDRVSLIWDYAKFLRPESLETISETKWNIYTLKIGKYSCKNTLQFHKFKRKVCLSDYLSQLKSMLHYSVKSVRIRSYYGYYFLALGLVSLCIQSDCVKILAGITPKNTCQKDEFITFNVHFPNWWAQWEIYAE